MCNVAFNACWNTATARRYWTEQWRRIKLGDRIFQFFRKRLINDDSSFCLPIILTIDMQCHFFPFEKLLLNIRLCKRHFWWRQIWHLHVMMLQCWTKFSNVLVQWSIRMIRAKNYEAVSKFVKVMPRILRLLFSGHDVCTWCMLSRRRHSATTGLRDRMPVECMLISGVMPSGPEAGELSRRRDVATGCQRVHGKSSRWYWLACCMQAFIGDSGAAFQEHTRLH